MSQSRPPRFLWVTDPWDTLDHPRDTTLRLIEESLVLGFESFWCDLHSIRWQDGAVRLDACRVEGVFPGRASQAFRLAAPAALEPREFTSIHYRTDPPVDLAYLHPLQLLVLGTEGRKTTEIVNPPQALFLANEKLEGAHLADLMPPSLAGARWDQLEAFGRQEGRTVLKPLHQAQSKGVELLAWNTDEERQAARRSLEAATSGFTTPVLLQHYLEGIARGEQRLWFLNGHLLAVARKLPKPGEFRINMDLGGTLAMTELSAAEKKAAARIGKRLRARRIRMAAVDLIEGFVTDFNFTSPGLLTQMEALLGTNLARPVLESLARPWT